MGDGRAPRPAPGNVSLLWLSRLVLLGRLDRMRDAGLAVTRHPDALTVHAAVQLAATAVLLHEGVKGGEEGGPTHSIT